MNRETTSGQRKLGARPFLGTLVLVTALAAAPAAAQTLAGRLVDAAREQVGVTLHYDPGYYRLAYPGGDLPLARGVCTDVVVRAYRVLGADLQKLVHEDMLAAWEAYPGLWGLSRPDPNIDHRRVPNLATFFARHGQTLAPSTSADGYVPGDVVTWRLPSGSAHIGIVSDRTSPAGTPLILHNIGRGAREEDVLFSFEITGHFRWEPESTASAAPSGAEVSPRP